MSSLFSATDIPSFRNDRLVMAAQNLLPEVQLSDAYLLSQIHAAEAEVAQALKVYFKPTVVFPLPPSDEEIAAVPDGMDWDEEPGYDYETEFFQADSWGYLVLRHRPVIAVESIKFAYPAPGQVEMNIPAEWIRLDKKYGHVRLVPAANTVTLPLSVFVMQVMGGGRGVPSAILVKYTAGLKDVREDPKWANLVDVILKKAALKVIDGAFLPQSGSISADGMSQSMSVDTSKYRDGIDEALFGPKGSNGGLWTVIHGVGMSVLGVMA